MTKIKSITPILDHILVTDINFGEQTTKSGIVLRSDNGKSEGIKPRWGQVYAVGPDRKDVSVGEWCLIEHGRWTRGIEVFINDEEKIEVFRIDPEGILMVTDEKPDDPELGSFTTPTNGSVYNF